MRSVCTVSERVQETPSTITLRFDYPGIARPGQFVMIWVPGDDELPMSLSYVGDRKGVTVKVMGETSRRMQGIPVGAKVGIRGPYGNAFDLRPPRILIVAGGSGAAVLAPAAEAAKENGAELCVALGATTASELLFDQRFQAMGARVFRSTDDGSVGQKGYVTGVAAELIAARPFDAVWTCGPEVMMQKVIRAAEPAGVPVFCSVERHMKCARGLCDACSLGPYHVCVDGPVFPAPALTLLDEFGAFKRDPAGRRVRA
ncbi:MAG: dihydroorotate dehydrogenase electron transfer subunit [Thermoplasmata archaeon]|nr:dihydroorotate dehydrogenase electron transfer subunit [Thermoplasmata archaeon]